MNARLHKMHNGLSLVELMVTVAIIVIIGGALMSSLVLGGAAWHSGDAEIQTNQEARKGIMAMARELRQTRASSLTTMEGALYLDNATYNSVLFQVVWDNNGDGSVITSTGGTEWSTPVTYYVNNGQLIRLQNNVIKVLANNVTSLQFCRQNYIPSGKTYPITTLLITLQTSKTTVEQRPISMTLTSSVMLRD